MCKAWNKLKLFECWAIGHWRTLCPETSRQPTRPKSDSSERSLSKSAVEQLRLTPNDGCGPFSSILNKASSRIMRQHKNRLWVHPRPSGSPRGHLGFYWPTIIWSNAWLTRFFSKVMLNSTIEVVSICGHRWINWNIPMKDMTWSSV